MQFFLPHISHFFAAAFFEAPLLFLAAFFVSAFGAHSSLQQPVKELARKRVPHNNASFEKCFILFSFQMEDKGIEQDIEKIAICFIVMQEKGDFFLKKGIEKRGDFFHPVWF